jgi:hypothetical protein
LKNPSENLRKRGPRTESRNGRVDYPFDSNHGLNTLICLTSSGGSVVVQAVVVTTVQRLVKQTLQRTDKRVDLIQEVLAAMDVVK